MKETLSVGLFGKSGGITFNNMVPQDGGHRADGLDEVLPCLLVYMLANRMPCVNA